MQILTNEAFVCSFNYKREGLHFAVFVYGMCT